MASDAVNQIGSQLGSTLGSGLASLGKYKIFFYIILGLIIVGLSLYILTLFKKKKSQWTHIFEVQRILPNGQLTEKIIHRAKRFQINTGSENFELEKPIIGNWIIPRIGDYINNNTMSIILDKDNRIYTSKGTVFDKDKGCKVISIVHAGADVTLSDLKATFQQAHKNAKKITTAELIKAGLTALLIIAAVIIMIVGLGKWSEVHEFEVETATQQAQAMSNLGDALETMKGVVNTQQLQITPMLEALYGGANIAEEINKYRDENEL